MLASAVGSSSSTDGSSGRLFNPPGQPQRGRVPAPSGVPGNRQPAGRCRTLVREGPCSLVAV